MDNQRQHISIYFSTKPTYCWLNILNLNASKPITEFLTDFECMGDNWCVSITCPFISQHVTYKCTAYTKKTKPNGIIYYDNIGTFIVSVRLNSAQDKTHTRSLSVPLITLQPLINPQTNEFDESIPWEYCDEITNATAIIKCTQLYCIYNLKAELQKDANKIIRLSKQHQFKETRLNLPCGSALGFLQYSKFDFDMPFSMPSAIGNRFMEAQEYSLIDWINLTYVACRVTGLSLEKYNYASVKQKQNILCALSVIALGASWTCGYENELIDDTSAVWASLGTNKDCDDFTTTFVSLTNFILTKPNIVSELRQLLYHNYPPALTGIVPLITEFILNNFRSPCMVCGWIKGIHTNPTKNEFEGHAWGAVYNLITKTYFFVECTGPVLPHQRDNSITLHEQLSQFYNLAITSPLSTSNFDKKYYGPANLQPLDRYLCVSAMYTEKGTFALVDPKFNTVGLYAKDFLTDNFKKINIFLAIEDNSSKKWVKKIRALTYYPNLASKKNITKIQDIMKKNDKYLTYLNEDNEIAKLNQNFLVSAICSHQDITHIDKKKFNTEQVDTFCFTIGNLLTLKKNNQAILTYTDKT